MNIRSKAADNEIILKLFRESRLVDLVPAWRLAILIALKYDAEETKQPEGKKL